MSKKRNPEGKKKSSDDGILDMLEERGTWYSGEELAALLGVSRAAVAKRVAGLRAAGNVIDSSTNRGYRLRLREERVDPDLALPHSAGRVMGRVGWRVLDETASTNNEAVLWALEGAPEGAVVSAERQTMGKGRRGHAWFSPPRSLQVSVILRPPATDEEAVTRGALAAMADAIASVTPLSPRAKPPNDLLVDGRKVAGVLVESGRRGDEPDWLVMGIGCNVNVLRTEIPAELAGTMTSLYALTETPVSRNVLLGRFLSKFELERQAIIAET